MRIGSFNTAYPAYSPLLFSSKRHKLAGSQIHLLKPGSQASVSPFVQTILEGHYGPFKLVPVGVSSKRHTGPMRLLLSGPAKAKHDLLQDKVADAVKLFMGDQEPFYRAAEALEAFEARLLKKRGAELLCHVLRNRNPAPLDASPVIISTRPEVLPPVSPPEAPSPRISV